MKRSPKKKGLLPNTGQEKGRIPIFQITTTEEEDLKNSMAESEREGLCERRNFGKQRAALAS